MITTIKGLTVGFFVGLFGGSLGLPGTAIWPAAIIAYVLINRLDTGKWIGGKS